jgi:hypothetical protein
LLGRNQKLLWIAGPEVAVDAGQKLEIAVVAKQRPEIAVCCLAETGNYYRLLDSMQNLAFMST